MPMKTVLIANRGEIAVRIARACADYGVRSVAVYADADAGALHTRAADGAWALEGASPAETYLSIDRLLDVARRSGADAVHPGYGFLSESAAFARAVTGAGLIWIGPTAEAIERLGDKVEARRLALQVGAPLVQGTPGPVKNAAEVLAFAQQHGLPIAIKAAFGGGGRGLKVARQMDEIEALYDSAVREAITAFGRGECFVEQFLDQPRHIEAQVIADQHGHIVVLGTRDCSLQRRNQKLVEEAPAPFLSPRQRERIHRAAHDLCAAAGYTGAGTVEFLLSPSGAISFLEVNTRLQVEHPVTEETSGVDLVVEQLRVADGLPLSITQAPEPRGHAFEFRINAEDVGRGFLPAPGRITAFDPPSGPGVRLDSGVEAGSLIPGQFDSLVAKLIVTGATRRQALARARRALAGFTIEGVPTVLPFHRDVVSHPDFTAESADAAEGGKGGKAGDSAPFAVHTRWIETVYRPTVAPGARPVPLAAPALQRTAIEVDGRQVMLGLPAGLLAQLGRLGAAVAVGETGGAAVAESGQDGASVTGSVTAPISGSLLAWSVADGDSVTEGQPIATMEAMKMEMQVVAPRAGRIRLRQTVGAQLGAGAVLADVG